MKTKTRAPTLQISLSRRGSAPLLALIRCPFKVTTSSSLHAMNWNLLYLDGNNCIFAAISLQEYSGPPILQSKLPTGIPNVLLA
mmetsp:Transcript_8272/g.13069  ORF Transcript_8272/g.13069 Transcript_8272/m.13069 type:complete len:84 (-) Transcript_8272:753-1004(-)